jgi:hypothetical protein
VCAPTSRNYFPHLQGDTIVPPGINRRRRMA